MENLKWVPLILFIIGTIFRAIGDHKESQRFGPYTITSIILYSIGFIICIIGTICSLTCCIK